MKNIKRFLSVIIATIMVIGAVSLVACNVQDCLLTPEVTVSEDGVASWHAVVNATGYVYKINNGAEVSTSALFVQLADGESIVVKAVAPDTNYADSAYSKAVKYTAPIVAQPLTKPVVNVSEDGTATWEAVSNASGYAYKIDNGAEVTTTSRSVALQDGQSIVVKAVGDGVNYKDSEYSDAQTYIAPVVATYFYMKDADVVQDGEVRYMVYTTNKTDGERDSVIAVVRGELVDGEWTYGERTIAVEGGNGWDKNIGSASITKGAFTMGGEEYSWLMAYCGSENSRGNGNQIGLAVAKDPMGAWVKVGSEPIITFDSSLYGSSSIGCYAPSVVNYNKASGIRIFYTYADIYGHFARYFDADLSNLDSIDGNVNMMLPTNGHVSSGDAEVMFPNADWAYDATNGKFYAVKDYSPSAVFTPSYAYMIQLLSINEAELYTVEIGEGWQNLGLKDYIDLTGGEYSLTYSPCIVSDAYGHIISADQIEVIYNVCETASENADYIFTQQLKTVLY